MTGDNRFVFIAPMYNASETIGKMLYSICGQSYENWKVILIDDVSEHKHYRKSVDVITDFTTRSNLDEKISVIWNEEKKWEVKNVLDGISLCEDDDIVCRIDADDWLVDLDALYFINEEYKNTGCDLLWTAHRWSFSDKNISRSMPDNADPYLFPWVSSHLKTFRKCLLNGVNDVNFRGSDGNYIRRAGDQAIYLPALHNSKKHVFLPRVMYHYTIKDTPETYSTNDAHFQREEANFLRNRGYVK